MTYEELRLKRNKTYLDYDKATDIAEKMRLLACWKALCVAVEEAYKKEILTN